jgi:hypothetical protein
MPPIVPTSGSEEWIPGYALCPGYSFDSYALAASVLDLAVKARSR